VAGEEPFGFAQALLSEPDVAAEPQHQRPTAEVADGEPDAVPRQRREKPDQRDRDDVELPGAGVDRGGDPDRLPRAGTPKSSTNSSPPTAR
jgi:hypothetical protein